MKHEIESKMGTQKKQTVTPRIIKLETRATPYTFTGMDVAALAHRDADLCGVLLGSMKGRSGS